MELRLLRYFLTVAKEQSFTKAAEQLHITQPTLSRQMAAFEEDLGITLFIRNGKKISLTDEGILLKRRALEILNLEERTLEELKGKEEIVESTITIGCGEFAAVETLAKICKTYKEKYPLVQIVLHTATADTVYESKWNNKKRGRDDCRGSKSRFTSCGSGVCILRDVRYCNSGISYYH